MSSILYDFLVILHAGAIYLNFFVVIGVKVDLNERLAVRKLDTFNPNFVG